MENYHLVSLVLVAPVILFLLVEAVRRLGDPIANQIRASGVTAIVCGALGLMTALAVKVEDGNGQHHFVLKEYLSLQDVVLLTIVSYVIGTGLFNCVVARPFGILLQGFGLFVTGLWNVSIGLLVLGWDGRLYTTMETAPELLMTSHPILAIGFGVFMMAFGVRSITEYREIKRTWRNRWA